MSWLVLIVSLKPPEGQDWIQECSTSGLSSGRSVGLECNCCWRQSGQRWAAPSLCKVVLGGVRKLSMSLSQHTVFLHSSCLSSCPECFQTHLTSSHSLTQKAHLLILAWSSQRAIRLCPPFKYKDYRCTPPTQLSGSFFKPKFCLCHEY